MPETVRIGHHSDFRPFAYVHDGRSQGILIEIAKLVVESSNIQIEFAACALDNSHDKLKSGDLDAFVGTAITKEREKELNFSPPLLTTGAAWFVPSTNNNVIGGPKIRTVTTPRSGPLIALIHKLYPTLAIKPATDYFDALGLVASGDVDAAALNYHAGRYYAQCRYADVFRMPDKAFHELQLAMVFGENISVKVIDTINSAIISMTDNGEIEPLVNGALHGLH